MGKARGSHGGRTFSPSQRLKLAALVRGALAETPDASVTELVKRLGISQGLIEEVRRKVLKERGS